MNYKGMKLKEITVPQVFDPPRQMFVWDKDVKCNDPLVQTVYAVIRTVAGTTQAVGAGSARWLHCAEIPEEPKPRSKPTNKELAEWCAKGNGQIHYIGAANVHSFYSYQNEDDDSLVTRDVRIRKFGDTEWREPTVNYMGIVIPLPWPRPSTNELNELLDVELHAVDMPKYLEKYSVKIGNQTWMSENLAVTDGGDDIYRNKDTGEYYYTWEAAKRIADKIPGWHLPSGAEWDELDNATGNDAANLRAKSWNGAREGSWFAAVPVGHWCNGFNNVDSAAYFWTSEPEGMNNAWYRVIGSNAKMYKEVASHWVGLSVRLVKDK